MLSSKLHPNREQVKVVESVKSGNQVVIVNAFAGTGKTSTLELVAEAIGKRACYLVFNRKNADEARKRLPSHVQVTTAHGLAYRSLHPDYGQPMAEFYSHLLPTYRLVREYLAGQMISGEDIFAVAATLRNYCQSCDKEPGLQHIPPAVRSRGSEASGMRYAHLAKDIFDRIRCMKGPGSHDLYLKLYSLHPPELRCDLVFIDEAQDLNPCMLNIIEAQIRHGKQVVLVGDRYQHIYGFNGAVDAMAIVGEKYPAIGLSLTGSYRFGEKIAEVANRILEYMYCPRRIRGLAPHPGVVRDVPESPRCGQTVIYRKNISMLQDILSLGNRVNIRMIGGWQELRQLLQAAFTLYSGRVADHAEIGMFHGWQELVEFAGTDAGRHLWPVVNHIEEHRQIDDAVAALSAIEENSRKAASPETTVTMTTAHKAKGLEFRSVLLHSDMGDALREWQWKNVFRLESGLDELFLIYVGATRAREELNLGGIGHLLSTSAPIVPPETFS